MREIEQDFLRGKIRENRLGMRGWLMRFAREEDGVIVGFAVFLFLIILMIGGVGIDVMYSEMKRTKMQHTLDRAILAAADLDQTRSPDEVVADYFNKAGMSDYLSNVTVSEGLNYRQVEASAKTETKTMFMKMVGVDTLSVPASGTAVERIGNIEISLVLDVSGSMNSNSRLTNLKVAAKEFVQTMDDNTEDGTLSVSIVPYATQVSGPTALFDKLNVTAEHTYSNCVDFDSNDFTTTAITPTQELQRTAHFDPWNENDWRDDDPSYPVGGRTGSYNNGDPVCEVDPSRQMVVLQNNTQELKDFIDDMWGGGNTSIDIGMKWGTALLDPALQPAIEDMVDDGTVPADFSGRPFSYADAESLKVIVLMTDGKNTTQYYIKDEFSEGASNIWWNEQEEIYSIYVGQDEFDEDNDGVTEEPLFYWPGHTDPDGNWRQGWFDHAWGNGVYEEEETTKEKVCKSYRRNGSCRRYKWVKTTTTVEVDEPGEAVVVKYPDLWAYTSPRWVADQLYAPWMGQSSARSYWDDGVQGWYGTSTKNSRAKSVCDAAKDEGIIVFTIGFEAPSEGQAVLKDCASSDSHYFDVDGLEIRDAFAAIATSIRQLRLTQ
ncbi:TadE/TadG family type IV pilus assembly protein [Thiosulfatihalobacter marinus]|uniref:TadE/TadG family type IV pilus assembly protein n=1 Tax=Thiosulfatihalobacter marinus TaxID=2792481 RepID=UPI001E39BAEE|nr:TadE/TadG family type IV pilus assembly protein [Thiosulfatihalobacter marinus]